MRGAFDDIVRFWWDRGVSGFRIDVCNMMIKDAELRDNPPATEDDPLDQQVMGVKAVYNSDRPEAHDILRRWRVISEGYPTPALLIGETNVEQLTTLAEFYGDGHNELHGGFNFVFINAALEAGAMRAVVEETEALLPAGAWPIWTGSNHDVSRLATRWAEGDPAKVRCALLILLDAAGTPFLYQGDEIGLTDGPIARSDVRDAVGIRYWPYYKGRDPERTPMPWSNVPGGGFTAPGVTPWLPLSDPARCNVADQSAETDSVLAFTRRAIACRTSRDDLAVGSYRSVASPEGTWVFERGEHTVVALNMSATVRTLDTASGSGSGSTVRVRVRVRVRVDHSQHRSGPRGHPGRGRAHCGRVDGRGHLVVTGRRFLLCTTPAQGHTAPLLAVSRRLVECGHEVVFFTTEHYRDPVTATGAVFVPFAAEYDAHDLMVANPDREASSARGVRGVKDDLRRIFVGPLLGQYTGLVAILSDFAAEVLVADSMFFGALPFALGPRAARPALACVGVMPLVVGSRDTAPFGTALQPGTGPLRRLRNVTLNWAAEHVALRDIQRLARTRLAEAGAPSFAGSFIDLPPKVVDVFLQETVPGFEYPRADLPRSIRFVGPILAPPATGFDPPDWWAELGQPRPVVHVTQGTLDNADLNRLLRPAIAGLAVHDVLVVVTTGGPDPAPLRPGLPANVRLERFIPHDRLLPHVDVMVTNGGYGGVQQALAHGVPLVVAGDSEDKPEVAARVRWSGTGIDLRTGKPSPSKLDAAVRRVLAEPSYRARAGALAAEIAATDPLGTITDVLVELARSGGTRPGNPR